MDSSNNVIENGGVTGDINLIVDVTDTEYGSGLYRLSIWKGDPDADGIKLSGHTEFRPISRLYFMKDDIQSLPSGTIVYVCAFDMAHHKSKSRFRLDFTPPKVISISPANGDKDVPVDLEKITITFSEEMDPGSCPNPLQISPSIQGSLSWTSDHKTLTFTPSEFLKEDTEYKITVSGSLRDLAGNYLDGNRFPEDDEDNANGQDHHI